jgi:hypothetical protein
MIDAFLMAYLDVCESLACYASLHDVDVFVDVSLRQIFQYSRLLEGILSLFRSFPPS